MESNWFRMGLGAHFDVEWIWMDFHDSGKLGWEMVGSAWIWIDFLWRHSSWNRCPLVGAFHPARFRAPNKASAVPPGEGKRKGRERKTPSDSKRH